MNVILSEIIRVLNDLSNNSKNYTNQDKSDLLEWAEQGIIILLKEVNNLEGYE